MGAQQLGCSHPSFCLLAWDVLTLPRQTRPLPRFLTLLCSLAYLFCLPTSLPPCLTDPLLHLWSFFISYVFRLVTQTSAKELDVHKGFLSLCPLDLVFITPTLLPGYTLLLVPHLKIPPLLSRSLPAPSFFPTALSPHYPTHFWIG